jgi:hypothetical protein
MHICIYAHACQVGLCYSATFCRVVSASGRSLHIWDAEGGTLWRTLLNVCADPISALCLDETERNFIVGDHGGAISMGNLATGAALRKVFSQHAGEVLALRMLQIGPTSGRSSTATAAALQHGEGGKRRQPSSSQGALLVSVGCDPKLHLSQLQDGSLLTSLAPQGGGKPRASNPEPRPPSLDPRGSPLPPYPHPSPSPQASSLASMSRRHAA